MTVRADDTEAGHGPQKCVEGRRLRTKEVPSAVMGSGCLRYLVVWAGLHRMDKIRKLNGILDEKHRDVVPDNV